MLVDGRTIPSHSRLEADLCIIGAGAAGITLARQFIGTPTRVLVIESGDVDFDPAIQTLAEGDIVGLPYFPLASARLRWLGGTTNHWGGHCRPMVAQDFEAKPWIPHTGWPIGLKDVEPYYERARIACGVPTRKWTIEAWRDQDPFKPLPLLGNQFVTRVAQIVPRDSRNFRLAYRPELEASKNVTVHTRTNVIDIETDEAGALATQLHVVTLAGTRFFVSARQVVLAVGGIENARLLLASNRQWPEGLGNRHDVVGRFFLEHPRFFAGVLTPSVDDLPVGLYDDHSVGGTKLQGYLSLTQEVQRREQLTGVELLFRPVYSGSFDRALKSGDIRDLDELVSIARRKSGFDEFGRHLANVVADLTTWQSMAIPGAPLPVPFPEVVGKLMRSTPAEAQSLIPDLLGDIAGGVYARTHGAPIRSVLLRARIDPAPNPESRVTLGEERDALGIPRVRLDWRLSPLDRRSVRRTIEILGAEVGRASLGRVRLTLGEDEKVWPEDLAGGYHHIGTTRMSDDPQLGVVDRNCQVHGIHNLFVAGSSVFPRSGSGTPTLTIVALAMRLADHLKSRLA